MKMFLAGMLMMAYATVAFFFTRFWRRTGDQLFAAFAVAFVLLAVQRVLLAVYVTPDGPFWVYLVRLAAFVVILLAIAGKNMLPRRRLR